MSMIIKKVISIITFSVVAIVLFGCIDSAQAESLMRLKKPKLRMIAPPGGTSVDTIELENPADKNRAIKVYLEDWKYKDATGSKNFFPPGTTELSAANWLNFHPKEFVMPPFGKETVNVSVNVPEGEKEAKYAVLFFETSLSSPIEEGKSDAALTVLGRIGTLIYVEPDGTIRRDAVLRDLEFRKKDDAPGYEVKGEVFNSGNVDAIIEGTFNIINAEGEVFARGQFNNAYTLQGDKGGIIAEWGEPLPAGKYDMIISLDAGGKPIVQEMSLSIGPGGDVLKQ